MSETKTPASGVKSPYKQKKRSKPSVPTTPKEALALVTATPTALEVPVTYRPNETIRRLKCAFWAEAKDLVLDDSEVTPALIKQVLAPAEAEYVLDVCEANPAAYRWFVHSRETAARIEYLFQKALDALENIIDNPDPRNNMARAGAARQLGELASKFKPRNSKEETDTSLERLKGQLSKMTKEELAQYLGANASSLKDAMSSTTIESGGDRHGKEDEDISTP